MARTSAFTLQGRNGINQRERLLRVVAVGPGELNRQRNSTSVANQMTLAPQFGPISRIRSRLKPQKLPGSNFRPRWPVTSRSVRNAPAGPAKRSGGVARYHAPASRAVVASNSFQSHSSSLAAASPKESRFNQFPQPVRQEFDGHWTTPLCKDVSSRSTGCWRNEVLLDVFRLETWICTRSTFDCY